jgi:hypothetical protein
LRPWDAGNRRPREHMFSFHSPLTQWCLESHTPCHCGQGLVVEKSLQSHHWTWRRRHTLTRTMEIAVGFKKSELTIRDRYSVSRYAIYWEISRFFIWAIYRLNSLSSALISSPLRLSILTLVHPTVRLFPTIRSTAAFRAYGRDQCCLSRQWDDCNNPLGVSLSEYKKLHHRKTDNWYRMNPHGQSSEIISFRAGF